MSIKEKMNEVLNKVLANIKEKGRCIEDNVCQYWKEDEQNGCAVGICLDPKYQNDKFSDENICQASELFDEHNFDILAEEYRDIQDCRFWSMLQNLHDHKKYWNEGEDGTFISWAGSNEIQRIESFIECGVCYETEE